MQFRPAKFRVMKQRIYESGTMAVDPKTKALRVRLIREGKGSSADYKREFFSQRNAEALAGSLSFPAHPVELDKPHLRDPLSAIGSIGDTVTIEENAEDGLMEMWGEFIPPKSKPQIAEYLAEFGHKLGLSIYADCDGHTDSETGRFIAEALDGGDPYKSVDLVVAAGAGGKFERVAESLGLITKTTATAEEKEVTRMDKDIEERFDKLSKTVEGLVEKLDGKHQAALQVQADETAVEKAVESRVAKIREADDLILGAKLTESQTAELRALALTGVDVAPHVEAAKKVLTEALALAGANPDGENGGTQRVTEHFGGSATNGSDFDIEVANFGRVG